MLNTPSDIEILLHYYVAPTPHPRRDAPAVAAAIERFVNDGILVEQAPPFPPGGRELMCSEKGVAWLHMICNTPYPEHAWLNPLTGSTIPTT